MTTMVLLFIFLPAAEVKKPIKPTYSSMVTTWMSPVPAEDPPATVHAVVLDAPVEVVSPSRSSGGKGTVPAAGTNPPHH